ncbi:hypothetical protein DAI22_07g093701 [Oryza sativa Japonica Group]|nr:hypothetical protein DAI22_07g093701 [Oryza sativa Japonica Group]
MKPLLREQTSWLSSKTSIYCSHNVMVNSSLAFAYYWGMLQSESYLVMWYLQPSF